MFVRLLQLPYARLIYCDSPKRCIWQEVLHTQTNKSRGRLKQGNPSQHRMRCWVVRWLLCSLLGRGVRRLPPLFRDAVWPSLPRADGRVSPSESTAPTLTDRQNKRGRKRGKGARYEKWTRRKEKHILEISNNQISHFHNSTFLNKLSRLSHQTILPRPSRPFFICVLIGLCRGPQLRECPVVSRVRKQSCGLCEHRG